MPSLSTLYRRGIDVREAAYRSHITLKTARREYAKFAAQEAADRERAAAAAAASPSFTPIGAMPFVLDVADSRFEPIQPANAMFSYTYHSAITQRALIESPYNAAAAY